MKHRTEAVQRRCSVAIIPGTTEDELREEATYTSIVWITLGARRETVELLSVRDGAGGQTDANANMTSPSRCSAREVASAHGGTHNCVWRTTERISRTSARTRRGCGPARPELLRVDVEEGLEAHARQDHRAVATEKRRRWRSTCA